MGDIEECNKALVLMWGHFSPKPNEPGGTLGQVRLTLDQKELNRLGVETVPGASGLARNWWLLKKKPILELFGDLSTGC